MNIPASQNGAVTRVSPPATAASEKPAIAPISGQANDTFDPTHAQALRDAVLAGPSIRPDRIAFAKRLLADPDYPTTHILKQIATQLVSSATRGA